MGRSGANRPVLTKRAKSSPLPSKTPPKETPAPRSLAPKATAIEIELSICVFRGDPLDWQQFRHCALYCRFSGGHKPVVLHLVGAAKAYAFEPREDIDPLKERLFVKEIPVATFRCPYTKDDLVEEIAQTPIDNRSAEFTVSHWVNAAMKRLVRAGLITRADTDTALDEMVTTTLEAEDEPEP